MPWNNPLALPVGKVAPAIGFGNGVVFKPAPEGTAERPRLLDRSSRPAIPGELVGMVTGAAGGNRRSTGRRAARRPRSRSPGCDRHRPGDRGALRHLGKPLQAELGGNNAAVVLADVDLDAVVRALVAGAYRTPDSDALRSVGSCVDDGDRRPLRGPGAGGHRGVARGGPGRSLRRRRAADLASAARDRVATRGRRCRRGPVRGSCAAGGCRKGSRTGRVVCAHAARRRRPGPATVAQEEIFGPVTVLLRVDGVEEAIAVANSVEQGLVAAVCTDDAGARARLVGRAGRRHRRQIGPGPVPIHPDAPFGGWKASGSGPPEHGVWDATFATKTAGRLRGSRTAEPRAERAPHPRRPRHGNG